MDFPQRLNIGYDMRTVIVFKATIANVVRYREPAGPGFAPQGLMLANRETNVKALF